MRHVLKMATGAVLAGSLAASSAFAIDIPITPFSMFDPYGRNIALTGSAISELDWQPGPGLAVGGNPFGPVQANPFEFLYQLKLGAIIDTGGFSLSPQTLNGVTGTTLTNYEFTAIGRVWESATGLGGTVVTFDIAPGTVAKPNFIEIFADKYDGTAGQGVQSNVLTGLGYNDGKSVLTAVPIAMDSVFNQTNTNGNGFLDNQDSGTGSTKIVYQVTYFDPAFFDFSWDPSDNPIYVLAQFDGTLTTPPQGVESPVMWDGTVPNFFGPAGTTPLNTNDILLKVDGNSHFAPNVIPEPGTMLLLGTGLMGLAGYGRRRSKKQG